jgi:hypothetical protein
MYGAPQKKAKLVEWIDSQSRFVASVSKLQDSPPLVRMEIRVPRVSDSFSVDNHIDTHLEDNLFIQLQDIITLRPHLPHNTMLAVNPHLYEVQVRVDNFWAGHESGGNSGRSVRRGTVYVTGDAEGLRRLRGEKDTRFTAKSAGQRHINTDGSGVRGLTHKLAGGVDIRRMRTKELKADENFGSRWVCIDYSATHVFHCTSTPKCALRSGKRTTEINPRCFGRSDLYLVRDNGNEHDNNAIAVVCQSSANREVVGFIPRELASCLAPAMDAFVITMDTAGVYSDPPPAGDTRNRVWFSVHSHHAGNGDPESYLINEKLQAIPWWVTDDSPPDAT